MREIPVLPLFVAAWFFLSAGVLWYEFRTMPQILDRLKPIGFYLVGIGTFFVAQAISIYARTSCTIWDCTNLMGGIAIVLAATFIARFPMRQLWPRIEPYLFQGLAFVAVTTQFALALRAPAIQVRVAQAYGFLFAGVFAVGYLVYESFREGSSTGISIGLSLAPCCVVGHGLAMTGAALSVSLPLLGVPVAAPMLSAVLAPISLITVLYLGVRIDPDDEVQPTPVRPN